MNEFFSELGNSILAFFITTGPKLLSAIAALIFGIVVVKLIKKLMNKVLLRSKLDASLISFVSSIINFLLYFALIMLVAKMLGIPTTSFIALFSAVSLAVSLALKDSLANLANGMLIISTKPFKVGDFVEIAGISGTVTGISMLHTKLSTPDNKVIRVPNSNIIGSNITNYSANSLRRVDLNIGVAYGSDVEEVKNILMDCIKAEPTAMTAPEPMVRLKEQGASAIIFTMRAWCKGEDYWTLFFNLNESTYKALGEKGIEIPFNQMDVHIKDVPSAIENNNKSSEA